MLRIHYYRFDQDYTGWDLWLWEKGRNGSAYMFSRQEYLDGDAHKSAVIAEVEGSGFQSNEVGIIVRRGGWHERDLDIDRYFTLDHRTDPVDIYLIQDTIEIFTSREDLRLMPGFFSPPPGRAMTPSLLKSLKTESKSVCVMSRRPGVPENLFSRSSMI